MGSTTQVVSQEQRAELKERFEGGKPMSAFLPMVFPSGFRLTSLTVNCSVCQRNIAPAHFRCNMVTLLPGVVRIEGLGICTECRCAINYLFRLRDESTFVIEKINDKGQWTRYASKPVSRFRRAQRSLLTLLRKLWHS